MVKLTEGDEAPAFDLPDQSGKAHRLGEHLGRKVLVYFYPEADTPGCTTQSCAVRDAREDLAGLGVDVLGISPDEPDKQRAFDEKFTLGFPLLSDPDHAVAEAWGAWGKKNLYGNVVEGIIRSSFLVNDKGLIEKAWYRVPAAETVPRARKALAS